LAYLLLSFLDFRLTFLTFWYIYPVVDKDAVESTTCRNKKAICAILTMTSRSHYWIDPGDGFDLTPISLLVGV
jgi:hypothetical protein